MTRTIYVTALIHSLSIRDVEIIPRAALCVNQDGIIEWVEDLGSQSVEDVLEGKGISVQEVEIVEFQEGFVCPGFIDTHVHAPQHPNNGTGNDLQLLDWLEQITFPTEAKFSDLNYAGEVYRRVVQTSLNYGTTTSAYYATLHEEASKSLADICFELGQRAFIGKCNMDQNSPKTYIEATSDSIEDTKTFIDHFSSYPPPPCAPSSSKSTPPLVQPIITPRFAISCTPQLLQSLGDLSRSQNPSIAIQTHMSENPREIATVKEMFKSEGCDTYASVYDKYGLLGEGTILAHCVHLEQSEKDLLKKTGSGVSHCPASNLFVNSGAARVRDLLEMGVKVGLGTDCSGGPSMGILSAVRSASHISKFLSFTDPTYTQFSCSELFYLATMGGASLCRLQDHIGNFLPGKEFDAIWVKPQSPNLWVEKGSKDIKRIWEQWMWCGDDRDIGHVWVRGKKVGGAIP